MKRVVTVFCIILICFFTFWQCSSSADPDPDPAPTNNPPVITSITANPDTVGVSGSSQLSCSANDPDNNNLNYIWEASLGSISGTGANVTWIVPDSAGTYSVSCKVEDGNGGEDVDRVTIVVEQPLPTQGLIVYYPFNGNANDESGNGNNGTVHGAILTADRFGNLNSAYNFDGNDYIKASADNLPTAERTTSLWFNANTLSTRPALLGYGGKGYPGTSWWMNLNHGGTPAYLLGVHYTQSNYLKYFYSVQPTGAWINFVTTTDSSGSKIYINGEEKASNNYFINNTYVTGKDLAIGVNVSGNGVAPFTDSNVGYFKGIVDDIRVYNRALTEAEIQLLYHEGGWSK